MDRLTPSEIFSSPIHYHKDNKVPSRPDSLQVSISNTTPADWSYPLLLLPAFEDAFKIRQISSDTIHNSYLFWIKAGLDC